MTTPLEYLRCAKNNFAMMVPSDQSMGGLEHYHEGLENLVKAIELLKNEAKAAESVVNEEQKKASEVPAVINEEEETELSFCVAKETNAEEIVVNEEAGLPSPHRHTPKYPVPYHYDPYFIEEMIRRLDRLDETVIRLEKLEETVWNKAKTLRKHIQLHTVRINSLSNKVLGRS